MTGWFFPEVPLARLVWLRRAVYAVVILDVLVFTRYPMGHAYVPDALYRTLPVRSLLHLPSPSPGYVHALLVVIIASALLGIWGRWPRVAGWVCAVGMLDWISDAYSYSKVNHDHFALMVALFVLPLVAGRMSDETSAARQGAGWTLRMIQIATVATYFLACVCKVLDAGWGWASSAVLVWAVTRRGSSLGDLLAHWPWLTYVFQWIVFVAEGLAPVMLWLRGRWLYAAVAFWVCFHASTLALLGIHFIPTAVCLLAFLPLERLDDAWRALVTRASPTPRRSG